MADLALDKQNKIVFLLGYPAKVLVEDSTHFNRILKNRMLNILDDTVTTVDELLALIDSTRTKLDDTRDDSNVNRVGEIGLDPQYSDHYIAKQYRRYIRELSSVLDIPIRQSNFGGGSIRVEW